MGSVSFHLLKQEITRQKKKTQKIVYLVSYLGTLSQIITQLSQSKPTVFVVIHATIFTHFVFVCKYVSLSV